MINGVPCARSCGPFSISFVMPLFGRQHCVRAPDEMRSGWVFSFEGGLIKFTKL